MMSEDQIRVVVRVYNHFMDSEARGWDGLDDYIVYLDFLDDDQLHREADVIYTYHKNGKVRCPSDHPSEKCMVPLIVDSVGSIIELFKETGNLHIKNRYILSYYLAMQQVGLILVDP